MADTLRRIRIKVGERAGEVSALLLRPRDARCTLALAPGAGAGIRHEFLESMAKGLATRGMATLRYDFPYRERGSRRPDPPGMLEATVRAAVTKAAELTPDLPLLAGGKSMGGRMTSRAAARELLPGVHGIVFLGFPLHAAGRPSTERAEHLADVELPMLFVQGTRDKLAELELLRPICRGLARAKLHVVDGADHSFHVLKGSGRTDADVLEEVAQTVAAWAAESG